MYYDEKRSIAENIVLNYYKNNKPAANIKSDKAIITESMDIDLIGNVVIVTETDNRLFTNEIEWINKENILDTDEYIKIINKKGDVVEGMGLKADYNLDTYEIKHKVKAVTNDVPDSIKK